MIMLFQVAQMYVLHLNNDANIFCPMKMTLAKYNVSTGTTVLANSDLILCLFSIINTSLSDQ